MVMSEGDGSNYEGGDEDYENRSNCSNLSQFFEAPPVGGGSAKKRDKKRR